MRVLIIGDRFWECKALADRVVARLVARYGADLVVVHGGAPGVDTSFHLMCQKHGVTLKPFRADWRGLGKIAGPARNKEMVESGADLCIALHRTIQTSKGTKDCIRQALAAGIAVWLIEDDEAIPKRIQPDDERLVR
jgi:YspA, cpYpsA-related SLOG family